MKKEKTLRYSPELRERAVRLVGEVHAQHSGEWAAIQSVAAKVGCTAETLRVWCRKHQNGQNPTAATVQEQDARIKMLERENRELQRANEILRKAAAFFAAAELDRKPK